MSSYLNQIFYDYKKFDTKESFFLLEPFIYSPLIKKEINVLDTTDPIYSEKDMEKPLPLKEESIYIERKIQQEHYTKDDKKNHKRNSIIEPKLSLVKLENSFFWCLYIIKYGYDQFLEIGNKYANIELEEKMKIIDFMKKNPHILKNTNQKITKVKLQEILSDLMSNQHTSRFSFPLYCLYYSVSVFIVIEKTYLFLGIHDPEAKTIIVYYTPRGKYGNYTVDLETTPEKIEKIKEEMVCLDSFEKPFKGISSYKSDELEQIAKKMGVFDETRKMKKTELYEVIGKKIIL